VTRVLWSPEPASTASSSPQDRLLASASDDGYIMVWKMPSYPAESDSDRRNRPGSRSLSPSKQARDAEDDYFANGLSGTGGENCVRKFQACAEGRMILAA
jgi:WD40 repeat protein